MNKRSIRAGGALLVMVITVATASVCAAGEGHGHGAGHDGDAESRAMRMLSLQQHLERSWAAAAAETDEAKRRALLDRHAQALRAVQEALHDAAEKSPCVMMEARDSARQLACLVDTEARLRATERVLAHVIHRITMAGP